MKDREKPCWHCPDRFLGCHDVCEDPDYLASVKRRHDENINRKKAKGYTDSDHYREGWQFRRKKK